MIIIRIILIYIKYNIYFVPNTVSTLSIIASYRFLFMQLLCFRALFLFLKLSFIDILYLLMLFYFFCYLILHFSFVHLLPFRSLEFFHFRIVLSVSSSSLNSFVSYCSLKLQVRHYLCRHRNHWMSDHLYHQFRRHLSYQLSCSHY